jgi:single-stranded DNA-binding protein
MRIAHNVRGNGGFEGETVYIDGVIFRPLPFAMHKGDQIILEGKLNMSSWKAPDGGKRSKIEIMAYRVQAVSGPRRDGEQGQRRQREPEPARGSHADNYDDIPF